MAREILTGARIFDGTRLLSGHALVMQDGMITAILPQDKVPRIGSRAVSGILAPAFLDLQVNGGGGVMVDGTTDLAALRHICATHRALGTGGILPTLITDTPAATARVIAAGIRATEAAVPGFLGLHLEGPHLDPRRKGAHDPALIRPMTEDDLNRLCDAARHRHQAGADQGRPGQEEGDGHRSARRRRPHRLRRREPGPSEQCHLYHL